LRIIDFVDFGRNPQDGIDDRILSYDLLACLAPFLCIQVTFSTYNRLSSTLVSRLFPILRNNAYRSEKDDQGDGGVLSPFSCYRRGFLAEFLCVLFIANEVNVRLDSTNGNLVVMKKVLHSMTQAFLDSPDFGFYEDLTPPFGIYLFYLYNFIVSICTTSGFSADRIVLLNILIALFNQAYAVVTGMYPCLIY
jgi:hypothetical protein